MKHYFWIFVLAGIWLIIGPFVLGYSHLPYALWNSIGIGILVEIATLLGYVHEGD